MSHRLKRSTLDSTNYVFKGRILLYFGDKPINAITAADIRAWQNVQIDSGASDGYLRNIHKKMSAILNYAVTYYNLPSNPCHKAGTMGKTTRSMSFWTLEQYNRFIECVEDIRVHAAFQTLFYSGMRCGELLALTAADIDLDGKTIDVNKTYSRLHGEDIITTPKTRKSKRKVPIPDFLCEELKEYIHAKYFLQPTDRLFPYTKSFLSHEMIRGCKKTGVKKIRIHDDRVIIGASQKKPSKIIGLHMILSYYFLQ